MNPGWSRARLATGYTLAGLLGLIAFLPWASWLGYAGSESLAAYSAIVRDWMVWTTAVLAVAVVLSIRPDRIGRPLNTWCRQITALPASVYAAAAAVAVFLSGLVLSDVLFAHNPHHVDSVSQLFQARIFSNARITAPAPADYEFFAATHLVREGGRWFSQYPPGHAALLAIGVLFRLPWLVNPVFAVGTVLLLYGAARRILAEGSAKLAVALYVLSPFVLFLSASHMNHVTTGFFLALAFYAALRAVEGDAGYGWALTAGLALAAAATIRPLESVAWAGVLGAWLLMRGGWKHATVAGTACVLGLIPLLAYNAITTGHPLRFGYTLLWGPNHGLGFHTDPWGEPFTPLKSFAATALDFQQLNSFLFGWPFPSLIFLLVAFVAAFSGRRSTATFALLAGLLLAAPLAYFFYWHRDSYLGPRFLFPSLIPVLLLTAAGIAALDARLTRWRVPFRVVMVAAIAFNLALTIPRSAGRLSGLEREFKLHPEVDAAERGLSEALVLVKVSWGSRLISRLWSWGIPASETERTYRVVDGCRLQDALGQADSMAAAGVDSLATSRWLRTRLSAWRAMDLPVARDLLEDRSVRVDTTQPVLDQCYQEIVRDRTGFTVYGTLAWRNDPWLQRGVIYARSLGPLRDQRLMSRYPQHEYYLYAPLSPEGQAPPVLRRLERQPLADTTGELRQ